MGQKHFNGFCGKGHGRQAPHPPAIERAAGAELQEIRCPLRRVRKQRRNLQRELRQARDGADYIRHHRHNQEPRRRVQEARLYKDAHRRGAPLPEGGRLDAGTLPQGQRHHARPRHHGDPGQAADQPRPKRLDIFQARHADQPEQERKFFQEHHPRRTGAGNGSAGLLEQADISSRGLRRQPPRFQHQQERVHRGERTGSIRR